MCAIDIYRLLINELANCRWFSIEIHGHMYIMHIPAFYISTLTISTAILRFSQIISTSQKPQFYHIVVSKYRKKLRFLSSFCRMKWFKSDFLIFLDIGLCDKSIPVYTHKTSQHTHTEKSIRKDNFDPNQSYFQPVQNCSGSTFTVIMSWLLRDSGQFSVLDG